MDITNNNKPSTSSSATQKKKPTTFTKREGTAGISGQLYEIYLVLLIFLYGLTNKNITNFHLASNLKEASCFDDIVFSYSYKDLNGAEKFKVIFLQAKHKENMKNITLEGLLGKTGKGAFDLKKYFSSFRDIKKKFGGGNPTHPIFGRDFSECEFIIYTNALFKYGHTEKAYINELSTEEDWVLNFSGEGIKYHQIRFSGQEEDRIKKLVAGSDEHDFQEFLSNLKICTAQPNQSQLMEIIKEKIQTCYGVTGSDIETVFPVVKSKVEEWWQYSSEFLTEKNTFIQKAVRVSIRFEVQDPVPVFIGREQMLRDLHEALQCAGQSVISQSVSITGLGGIGKTELAKKYVSQYSQYYDHNVIWINAESYATCSESFRKLARDTLEIGIKTKDDIEKDITSIISNVYAFFAKRERKSLFIFDNAENPQKATIKEDENVTTFLPSGDNKPYVLITSRYQQWGGIKSLQLDVFTEEECTQFIIKSLSRSQLKLDNSEVFNLGKRLHYLPLALRQAVAYITMENERLSKWNENYAIGNYLNDFEYKARELLGKAPQDVYDRYTKTVLTTWQITIEKIKDEKYGMQTLLILDIIAFFSPDNINIVTIFENLMDKEVIRGCVEILVQYSMVKLKDGEVSIHRLLQQVMRMILKQNNYEEEIIEKALSLFQFDIYSNCVDHVRSVWDYAKNFNEIVQNFSCIPERIVKKIVDDIKYNEAYLFSMRTHKLFREVLGDNHHDTLSILHCIASILLLQGKYDEALNVHQDLLCKRKEVLGSDHHHTLMTMYSLALVLVNLGKYEESLILNQEIMYKQKAILGQDHPDTLRTMHNLALVLNKQGKYQKSFILYQEVLCKQREIIGPEQPNTLMTMHNLAALLDEQGKYEESLSLYNEVLCNQQQTLGSDHPHALMTMHNIASVLDKQGKYEESFILYQEVFCKINKSLGQDHPYTLLTMHNLASVLNEQGKYKESLIMYEKVLRKQKKCLGLNHPSTLSTMHNVASILEKQGKYEQALTLYQDVLCKEIEILERDHPDILTTMHNLASVLCKQEKFEESLNLYQEVLCKQSNILGLDHPHTLKTMNNIAFVLHKQGKRKESLLMYQEVLIHQTAVLGPDHPDTLGTINNWTLASSTNKFNRLQHFLKRMFGTRPS